MQTVETARASRDAAMAASAIGSGEGWQSRAFVKFSAYLRKLDKGDEFMAEQVRVWAHNDGLDEPKDPRAWGPVMKKAIAEEMIEKVGYAPAVTGHCRPMPLWVKL